MPFSNLYTDLFINNVLLFRKHGGPFVML